MKSNILVSSAGRRVELVEAFKQSLIKYMPHGKVFCSDMRPELSSACQVADEYFSVPRVTEDGYIDCLLNLCEQKKIGLVIPTIDTELLVLAENRHRFLAKGIQVIVSDELLISYCRDKRKTAELFDSLGIDQPKILDRTKLTYPCFCKPYDGSCSVGAIALFSESDLTREILDNPKNMFMEFIPKSYSEYTIDAYYSKDSILKCLVPRKRLEVRGGEVSKGVTRNNFVYDYLLDRAKILKGARGCITFQLFVNEITQSIKGLEINPRFGGGYPLAHDSGAHYTDWLIREFLNDENIGFFDNWEPNLIMLRYDAKVLVRESR
ncbi:TPA: ATP-grasp domain-containing protein [Vibrio vulnificus]|uniref:ATP-grasp domain-containing protein n=1 Tax=Vibrio vulnificus TaxID=672 RepID=UPI00102ADDA1|nr:ATP-grasp domain-containing protein [Vibrio vulnificus]EGR0753319.1 ATP-grasp domain-containing protein [Vibrio vulnificus]EHK9066799.1 ATP-grasp domain-containing protein [Vibrio vulnificus]EHU4801956.1 ATP-grasp domain-containing protein [Vibrio vulnificus]EIV8473832.1 ATP-grasp domain-containing protein [Vibrio vulnificus]RZQ76684.1 ATP-grasp domain-containing protein [Vibrio vulnificus]